jgi:hypothetical protein
MPTFSDVLSDENTLQPFLLRLKRISNKEGRTPTQLAIECLHDQDSKVMEETKHHSSRSCEDFITRLPPEQTPAVLFMRTGGVPDDASRWFRRDGVILSYQRKKVGPKLM